MKRFKLPSIKELKAKKAPKESKRQARNAETLHVPVEVGQQRQVVRRESAPNRPPGPPSNADSVRMSRPSEGVIRSIPVDKNNRRLRRLQVPPGLRDEHGFGGS